MNFSSLKPPHDFADNLRYRAALMRATKHPYYQQECLKRCADDTLWWVASFCWLHEPRAPRGKPKKIPFIPWTQQEPVFEILEENLGIRNVGIEKSRGEGVTWMILMLFLKHWRFSGEMDAFGLVSRNEDMADNNYNPDSLFYKIDWQLKQQPAWMFPGKFAPGWKKGDPELYTRSVRNHALVWLPTGATIASTACTGDIGRGGRKTAWLIDELPAYELSQQENVMAATEPNSDCRIFVGTPQGPIGEFYKMMTEVSNLCKVRMHWSDNEYRNKGLFRYLDGKIQLIDPNNPLPDGYEHEFHTRYKPMLELRGFQLDKGFWAPWFVERCLQPRMTPRLINQEYNIDYEGSQSLFFSLALLERLQQNTSAPFMRGELIFSEDSSTEPIKRPKWCANEDGRLLLWMELGMSGRPPEDEYTIGCDVSTGAAGARSSNSAICVANKRTGEKVAEFATPHLVPSRFADYAMALGYWFHNALLAFETNGPGALFRKRVKELGYPNLWFRPRNAKAINDKKSTEPGFSSNKERKRELLGSYAYRLSTGQFSNPSHPALEECKGYRETVGGSIEHVSSKGAEDPSGASENHADRAIADALACMLCNEYQGTAIVQEKQANIATITTAPSNSYGGRHLERMKEAKTPRYMSDVWKQRLRQNQFRKARF